MLRCSALRKAGVTWRSTRLALLPAMHPSSTASMSSSTPQLQQHDANKSVANAQQATNPRDVGRGGNEHITATNTPPRVAVLQDDPLRSFAPSAAEAPQLLQDYVEPTPFINPRRLQHFIVSMAVGVGSVGCVYYILQDRINRGVSEEDAQLAALAEQQRRWQEDMEDDEDGEKSMFGFIAPSTYAELRRKLEQSKREAAEREAAAVAQGQLERTSMFHAELIHRLKLWWNRSLTNVQAAVEQEERKERHIVGRIESTLRLRGYTVLRLSEADGSEPQPSVILTAQQGDVANSTVNVA